MKKQTAGRTRLGDFAPKFAELNDDVLFGEVWAREDKLSLRDRSMITVTVLMTKGIFDSSMKTHITNAKKNGVTAEEMAEDGPTHGPPFTWQKKFTGRKYKWTDRILCA